MENISRGLWYSFALIVLTLVQMTDAHAKYSPPDLLTPPQQASEIDPNFDTSWHLENIGAINVWQLSLGNPKTIVAVVDSGIDYNHPDLIHRVHRNSGEIPRNGIDDDGNGFVDDYIGWNFSEERWRPWDDNGHGTFVSGIIAATFHNGIGGAGVCPECSILPIRFLNDEGLGDTEDAVRGLNYAANFPGVKVINLSFAGEGLDQGMHNAIKLAGDHDIVVVVSAGNDGINNDNTNTYPANSRLPNLITVAATKRDGDLWINSNWGVKGVHIGAPGTTIWGPWIDGKWYRSQGTSLSAPVVAGAVGLLRTIAPNVSAVDIVKIIMKTANASRFLENKIRAGGTLNIEAAVQCARSNLNCL